LPKKLLFSGVAVSDNSIFVIGGWDEHYKATSIVLEGKTGKKYLPPGDIEAIPAILLLMSSER
jgi:hypothetical protein